MMQRVSSLVLKIGYGIAVLLGVIGLALLPLGPVIAATGVPKILNYQGRLMDANGVLLGGAGTEYCFKFSLYDSATVGSGTKLWPATSPSTTTATVKNGVFSVGIGDTSIGGDTLDFNFQDTDTVFVQVDVATKVGPTCAFGDGGEVFETLSPRQRIHASGYALNAGTVGGFLAAQYASGNQIPVLESGNLILGGTNPFLNATTSNTLTLQGGGQVTGDIQFFSSANKITAAGNATFAGNVTAASSTITNATSTTFFATLGRFTSAIIETLSATVATIVNLTATNFIATNATTTNATTTNFAVTSLASALLSTNAQGTLVATTSISSNYIDTSGNWLGLFDGQEGGYYLSNSFSSSSAEYFVNASSTIPKTYSDNVFTGGNVFGNTTTTNATTTNLSVSGLASTSGLVVSNLNAGSCDVKATPAGVLVCGTDASGGVDPFPSNATTSLLTFNGGLIAFSSSTVQNLSSSNATVTNATSTSFFSTLARFTTSIADSLTAAVATITSLNATNIITTNSTSTNATTTNFAVTSLPNTILTTNAQGTVVATTSISGNYIEKTGNWTGTFDGFEGSYYLANSFSTTSALAFSNAGLAFSTTSSDYWKSVNNFFSTSSALYFASAGLSFSTTSAQYFLLQNQGAAFSTTSAQYFVGSSTTIPKTYTDNTFTGGNVFQNTTSTNATSTTFFASLGRFTTGIVDSLTASVGSITNLTSTNVITTNATSTNATTTNLAITSAPSTVLTTDSTGRVVATTSISSNFMDTTGNWSGTIDGYEGNYLIANAFSTTSADFWKNSRNFFSTTSAAYFAAAGLAFSTTSADAWKNERNFFSTTSASSFAAAGLAWSTTSAMNFADASSTLAKTYTENVFTSGNTFQNTTTTNATTTNLAVSGTASTTQLVVSSLNAASCDVKATAAGVLICGTDATGTSPQDPFQNNATNTLLTFNGGLIAFGSSTIQNLSATNATVTNATSTSFFSTLARFTTSIADSLTAAVATITNLTATNVITTNATSTNATTTNLAITSAPNTVLTTDANGLVVATTSISANFIDTTGNWTGTFDGFEGSYYLANSFSTTSALAFSNAGLSFSTSSNDYWKSVNNFFSTSSSLYFASAGLSFSTTSAQYFLLQNQGAAFSTTSANYFADASTTIATTYKDNTFTGNNTFTQTIQGDVSGNAGTATALETARNINGVSFDGTSDITITAASSSLLADSNTFSGTNTFTNTVIANATTTNISSTNASTTNLIVSSLNAASCDVKATVAGVLVCGTDATGTSPQDPFVNGATTTMLTFSNGLMAFGSSTITNLNGTNATITNATSTSFFSTLARFTTAIADSLTAAVATITNLTSINFITVNSTSTNATTTNLAITTLPSTVLTTDATGRVVATTSISGNFIDTTGNWSGTFDGQEASYYIANSFSTSSATYFSQAGLSWATTSADAWKAANNFYSTSSAAYFTSVGLSFSTTSSDAWKSARDFFSTSSAQYLASVGLSWSTTSANYFAASFIDASTTIAKTYTANVFTAINTFTNGFVSNASSTIGDGSQAGGLTVLGGATTTGRLVVQGVGTSTFAGGIQTEALDVTGAATSTFANGIQLSSGCFRGADGTCLGSGSGVTGGAANKVAFFTSATTLSNNDRFHWDDINMNFGVGTSSPFAKLSVHAYANDTSRTLFAISSSTANSTTTLFSVDNTGVTTIGDETGTGDANFQLGSDANAWSTGYYATDKSFRIASSTNLATNVQFSLSKDGVGTFFGGVNIPSLFGCTEALETDGFGNIVCGTDVSGGGGGGSGFWSTTTDSLAVYTSDPSDVVLIGQTSTSTTGNILEVLGASLFRGTITAYNTVTAPTFSATSTTATSTLAGGLDVKAINQTGTATSTFTNGIQLSSGCFRMPDGTCVGGGSASLSGLTDVSLSGPTFGQLLSYNGSAWTNLSTSTLNISTTNLVEGSNLFYTDVRVQTYLEALSKGYFFSTTSASYFASAGLSFSTTSADAWKAANNFFSTSSAVYFTSAGLSWSTTSANYFAASFIDASTTIPKTYSANTFSASNIFNGGLTIGTLNGPLQAINGVVSATTSVEEVYGGTGQTTYAVGDILYASAAHTLTRLAAGVNGSVLKLAGGVPTWGNDLSGGGGGAGAWSTSTNDLYLFPADTTDVVVVGTNATTTTTSIFEVIGNSYFSSVVGIGTTSPGTLLSIGGVANFAPTGSTFYSALNLGQLVATSSLAVSGQTTLVNASSTALGALDYLAVGRTSTTTIQGNAAGTSTIRGFINVTGTNSTSTFSGGLAANSLSLTGAATSTAARGIDIASGCFAINGNCIGGVTSVSAANSSVTVSPTAGNVQVSLNLSNSNVWTGLQVFSGASTTAVSALDYVAIGRTATTTIQGGTTGTSTIQGFVNVTGTNSTSTFSGNLATNRLAVTGSGTSTFAGGIDITGGCIAKNGTCIDQGDVDGVTVTSFTGSGTWTKADYTGLTFTHVISTGAGGGGGGADSPDTTNEIVAGSGGAGGTAIEMIAAANLGTTETVTVGTAGTAGANTGTSGGNGGNSSFGGFHTANGGGLGTGNVTNSTGCAAAGAIANPGAGGTATGGDVNITGGSGIKGTCDASALKGGDGGASYWGGGGSGGSQHNAAGSSAGQPGIAYGSGGGGAASRDSTTGAAGAAGAGGIVVTMNYTSSSGDLAEWYETKADVEAGDVVAISRDFYEYDSRLGLQKSSVLEKAAEAEAVVGVVASAPNMTIGADVLGKAEHPSAIALAGRVPVKVSMENGSIAAGDLLTLSSTPGVAMRSTKAGVTIGRALEDQVCEAAEEVDEEKPCTVLIMVNTSYTTGALLSVALEGTGMDLDAISPELDIARLILAEMIQKKKDITASTTLSEVNTDRIAAGLEIITPRVLASTLVVDAIEPVQQDVRIRIAEEGKFVIEKVAAEDLSLTFDTASTTESRLAVSIDDLGNAFFSGTLVAANFEVGTEENPGGITMYDRDTKEPYCLLMAGGSLKTTEGKCGFSNPIGVMTAAVSDSGVGITDTTAPIVVVHGDNPAHIEVGASYVDASATANDDYDGEVSVNATIDNRNLDSFELDTSKDTNYTVVYRAVDTRGNVGRAIRTIIVGNGVAVPVQEETEEQEGEVETGEESIEVAQDTPTEPAPEATAQESVAPVVESAPPAPVTQEAPSEPQASGSPPEPTT